MNWYFIQSFGYNFGPLLFKDNRIEILQVFYSYRIMLIMEMIVPEYDNLSLLFFLLF